jgi:hypothetical protein
LKPLGSILFPSSQDRTPRIACTGPTVPDEFIWMATWSLGAMHFP